MGNPIPSVEESDAAESTAFIAGTLPEADPAPLTSP